MECDTWLPAYAVAESLSALESRDIFRQEGGDADGGKHSSFYVGQPVGAVDLSSLDGNRAA